MRLRPSKSAYRSRISLVFPAGAALVAAVAMAAIELSIADRRALSADEALYACAADARNVRWPIVDHPPLIGVPETEYLKAWFLLAP